MKSYNKISRNRNLARVKEEEDSEPEPLLYDNNSRFDLSEVDINVKGVEINKSQSRDIGEMRHFNDSEAFSLGDPLPLPYTIKRPRGTKAIKSLNFESDMKLRRRIKEGANSILSSTPEDDSLANPLGISIGGEVGKKDKARPRPMKAVTKQIKSVKNVKEDPFKDEELGFAFKPLSLPNKRSSVGSTTVVESDQIIKPNDIYMERNQTFRNSVKAAKDKSVELNEYLDSIGRIRNETEMETVQVMINEFKNDLNKIDSLFLMCATSFKQQKDLNSYESIRGQLMDLKQTFEKIIDKVDDPDGGDSTKKMDGETSHPSFLVEKNQPTTEDDESDVPRSDSSINYQPEKPETPRREYALPYLSSPNFEQVELDKLQKQISSEEVKHFNPDDLKSPLPEKYTRGYIPERQEYGDYSDELEGAESSLRMYLIGVLMFLTVFFGLSYMVADMKVDYCYLWC